MEKTNQWNLMLGYLLFSLVVLLLGACGDETTPAASSTNVGTAVYSSAFIGGTSVQGIRKAVHASASEVTEFKLCVRSIKLENANEEAVALGDEEDIKFQPGLIDVTAGDQKKWGNVTLPSGFQLKRIKIKVAKDKNLCGTEYALSFNGVETDEEIQMRFILPVANNFDAENEDIHLPLQTMVDALLAQIDADTLSRDSLKDAIEAVEEQAKIKNEDGTDDDDSEDVDNEDSDDDSE